jgi:hypothetical protein
MEKILSSVWCIALVISWTAQPRAKAIPAPTVATRSAANNVQTSDAPKTIAEFNQYLQTLEGQLAAWKQEVDAIPFDSLDIASNERGLLDELRSEFNQEIENAREDIRRIQSFHSLSDGIELLSDLYEAKDIVNILTHTLDNPLSPPNVSEFVRATTLAQSVALARQNRAIAAQISVSIRTVRRYLSQRATKVDL